MRAPFAPLVADAYEPWDDGGSFPLQEVTATPFTPEAAHFEMIFDHVCLTCKIEGRRCTCCRYRGVPVVDFAHAGGLADR